VGDDPDLRATLQALGPKARDTLRRVLIHDQTDPDAVSSQLLRYRDGHGDDWTDIIDMLTMHPKRGGRWHGCSARSRPSSDLGGRATRANGEGLARCSRPPVMTLGPPSIRGYGCGSKSEGRTRRVNPRGIHPFVH